jgi:hypothetical protein
MILSSVLAFSGFFGEDVKESFENLAAQRNPEMKKRLEAERLGFDSVAEMEAHNHKKEKTTATTRAAGSSDVVGRVGGMLQQLVMSDNPSDIDLLRSIASKMPPERFNALLVRSFRDPKSPADAPVLNHIGQEILNVSGGAEPSLTRTELNK